MPPLNIGRENRAARTLGRAYHAPRIGNLFRRFHFVAPKSFGASRTILLVSVFYPAGLLVVSCFARSELVMVVFCFVLFCLGLCAVAEKKYRPKAQRVPLFMDVVRCSVMQFIGLGHIVPR